MENHMTLERAMEFANAWNKQDDPDYIANFFAENGELHTSVGLGKLGNSFYGRDEIKRGTIEFFARFPGARFENIRAKVAGEIGFLEWEFYAFNSDGTLYMTCGCDILEFRGNMVLRKSAYRKVKG